MRNITGFDNPEGVAVDAQGRIYVADSGNDRVVILDANRVQIATLTADGMYHPATVAVDAAGRIYVSDTHNDRVLVYEWGTPDTTAADGTITFPANNAQVLTGPLTITGNATDNVGVTTAEVSIKRISTNQWWNGTAWQTNFKWVPATVTNAGRHLDRVDLRVHAAGDRQLPGLGARRRRGGATTTPRRPFNTFTVISSVDTVAPNGTVTVPTANQSFPRAPIAFSGSATDNVGVTKVQLAVKNRTTNQWWNGTALVTELQMVHHRHVGDARGGNHDVELHLDAARDRYAVSRSRVRADDAAGNFDQTQPFVNFSVAP